MEESVLACVLQNGQLYNIIGDICNKKDFLHLPYQWIFETFKNLHERESHIDLLTVQDEIDRINKIESLSNYDGTYSGAEMLKWLHSKEGLDHENCANYAYRVVEASSQRKIQGLAENMMGWVNQGNSVINILTSIDHETGKIASYSGVKTKSIVTLSDAVDKAVQETELASKGNVVCIETGIKALDEKIGGLFPGRLMVVAARTGLGKSSLVSSIAMNIALLNKWKKKVGIFSLEMNSTEYVNRIISALSGIPSLRLKMGKIYENEERAYFDAVKMLKENDNIILDDTSYITMPMIRNKIRRMKELGAEVIIVDQLGLISGGQSNEQEYARIDRMSYELKTMAGEFGVAIISVQQLNRSIESSVRRDKEPKPSDLQQAGEASANVIVMITHTLKDKVIIASKLWIVKHREGATGVVNVKFEAEKTYFRDLTPDELAEIDGTPEFMRDDDE